MNSHELAKEHRKQKRLEALGTDEPRCGVCGHTDYRALELHHVAGQKNGDATVILCRNCHRQVSDDQQDHPEAQVASDPTLVSIGNFLLGLASLLRLAGDRLTDFGRQLVEHAYAHREVA
ncbi:hypothetical protein [Acidisoma sp. S159]|uniref:hypothetical protein n=1 Tax=Acidisoma sp. S159 TaxID=1747225 RepID=UPI00131D95A0|nr:hypothetical protein [Acidisoma sp. S159]